MNPNSRIIIASGIKLDKGYVNVLSYTETQMLSLVQSLAVASANDFSFIRNTKNVISTPFTYSQCLRSDYIAFQNPYYDNKWFFAWIDDVNYVSDGCTQISYTIDVHSTWWDYWTRTNACYVVRQHSFTDSWEDCLLADSIQPEEYTINLSDMLYNASEQAVAVVVSQNASGDDIVGGTYNGIYSGTKIEHAFTADRPNGINAYLQAYSTAGRADAILEIYQIPKDIASLTDRENYVSTVVNKTLYRTLDGYRPVNNKLFYNRTYNYIVITNGSGSSLELEPIQFDTMRTLDENPTATFRLEMCAYPTPELRLCPEHYQNQGDDRTNSISIRNFPQCSWNNDLYKQYVAEHKTSWMMNGAAQGLNSLGGAITMAGVGGMVGGPIGALAGGAIGLLGGGISTKTSNNTESINKTGSIGSALQGAGGLLGSASGEVQAAQNVARNNAQVKGESYFSEGISIANNTFGFRFVNYCVDAAEAERIDKFFSSFGYQLNRIIQPNLDGRSIVNFVQIGQGAIIGSGTTPGVPMALINDIYRKGVSIWHNHSSIGDYSNILNNSIV